MAFEEVKETFDDTNKILPELEISMDEINSYLNMEYKIFYAMAIEELFEVSFALKKYSMYIKKEYNRSSAISRWCYNILLKKAKPLCANYNLYDKDERFYSVIRESQPLQNIQERKENAEIKTNMLNDLDISIASLVKMIDNLIEYKIREKRNDTTSKD